MRKNLFFGFGVLALLSVVGVSTIHASRYVRSFANEPVSYNNCKRVYTNNNGYYTGYNARYTYTDCLQKKTTLPFRPYAYRRAPFGVYRQTLKRSRKAVYNNSRNTNNIVVDGAYSSGARLTLNGAYRRYGIPNSVVSRQAQEAQIIKQHFSTPSVTARKENLYKSNRLVIRNGAYEYKDPRDNPNYIYSLQNARAGFSSTKLSQKVSNTDSSEYKMAYPETFSRGVDGVYRSYRTGVTFRVVEVDTKCTAFDFARCVDQVEQNFVEDNNLHSNKSLYSTTSTADTVEGSKAYYPVAVNTFTAKDFSGEQLFMNFSALNPKTGELVRIEAVGNGTADLEMTSYIVYKMIESFRFVQ